MKEVFPEQPDNSEPFELLNGEDMVARPDWGDICRQVDEAEQLMHKEGALTQADAYDVVREAIYFIEQQIGDGYASGVAEVVGWAHKLEYNQADDDSVVDVVAAKEAQLLGFDGSCVGAYDGIGLVKVDGRWRIALQVDFTGATNVENSEVYGFMLGEDKIVQLSLYAESESGVVDPAEDIRTAGEDAQQAVVSSEFLMSDSLAQRHMLGKMVARHEDELSHHMRDIDVVVATTQYYESSPFLPGELFPVTLDVDAKDPDFFYLEGKIGRFWYPDLESVDIEKQLIVDDFGIGKGAPYLTLEKRDAYGERIATYYIPTNDVQDIAAINADDEFDPTDEE